MQFPFLSISYPNVPITPILVSSHHKSSGKEIDFWTQILIDTISQNGTLLVISSDFCHFGPRYSFTPQSLLSQIHTPTNPEEDGKKHLHEAIEAMDLAGFDIIRSMDTEAFIEYLKKTGNTICGRNAILLAMQILKEMYKDNGESSFEWKLLRYRQSDRITESTQNAVSYLAAAYFPTSRQ